MSAGSAALHFDVKEGMICDAAAPLPLLASEPPGLFRNPAPKPPTATTTLYSYMLANASEPPVDI
jgi:hypothetical protein